MPHFVIAVDVVGAVLATVGFNMVFRQASIRRLVGKAPAPRAAGQNEDGGDPLTYILRICGTMLMVFGVVIAGMLTLFQLA